ncbi:single-pass membrane and coiled-coil domain-containing protein 1 [Porphyrio hochstetteri]
MAKGSISLRSLNEALNRVETKLQNVEAQFAGLDSSLQKLAQKFELQAEMLEQEMGQDAPWAGVQEERLGSEEEQREAGRRERPVSERRARAAGPQRYSGGGGHCGRPRLCLPPGPGTAAPPARSCSSVGADSLL